MKTAITVINDSGVTLTELLIVVSIIAILAVALGFSYQGWMGNYKIESETKQLVCGFDGCKDKGYGEKQNALCHSECQ